MHEVIRKGQKIIVKTVVTHKDFTQMKSLSNLLKLLCDNIVKIATIINISLCGNFMN